MGKTLKEKLEHLSPERQQKIAEKSKFLIAEEMKRQELRLALKLTQKQMSQLLQTEQINLSQMENCTDLMLSLLRKYIADIGGELRLVVEFPNHPPINILDIVEIKELESKVI
jgi:uncharacterized protein YehS (DUF1456 family)